MTAASQQGLHPAPVLLKSSLKNLLEKYITNRGYRLKNYLVTINSKKKKHTSQLGEK